MHWVPLDYALQWTRKCWIMAINHYSGPLSFKLMRKDFFLNVIGRNNQKYESIEFWTFRFGYKEIRCCLSPCYRPWLPTSALNKHYFKNTTYSAKLTRKWMPALKVSNFSGRDIEKWDTNRRIRLYCRLHYI